MADSSLGSHQKEQVLLLSFSRLQYWLWLLLQRVLYQTAVLRVASSALKEIHWIVILISDQIVEMLNTASISMATVKPNAAYTLFHVRNVAYNMLVKPKFLLGNVSMDIVHTYAREQKLKSCVNILRVIMDVRFLT